MSQKKWWLLNFIEVLLVKSFVQYTSTSFLARLDNIQATFYLLFKLLFLLEVLLDRDSRREPLHLRGHSKPFVAKSDIVTRVETIQKLLLDAFLLQLVEVHPVLLLDKLPFISILA
jgi:hypothetical protein